MDFDGVIHKYSKGWHTGQIYDEPVEGAIHWLLKMQMHYEICIYSSRSKDERQLQAMKDWLNYWINNYLACFEKVMTHRPDKPWAYTGNEKNGWIIIRSIDYTEIKFPTEKPAAWLTIDDRAICFKGEFPSIEMINNFEPWNKKA